jgi:chromosome segregation ATPase
MGYAIFVFIIGVLTILYLLGRMSQEKQKVERAHNREAAQRKQIGELAEKCDMQRDKLKLQSAEIENLTAQLEQEKAAFQQMSEMYDEKIAEIAELKREVEDLQTANAALSTMEPARTSTPIRKTNRKKPTASLPV